MQTVKNCHGEAFLIWPGRFENKTKALKFLYRKLLLLLFLSFLFSLYPVLNLLNSVYFLQNASESRAEIVEYVPEILKKAGGRRQVTDYYFVSYSNHKKKIPFGVRTVKAGEVIEPLLDQPTFKTGDTLAIIFLPDNPDNMIIKPKSMPLLAIYNNSSNIALIYLLKVISILIILYTVLSAYRELSAGNNGK